VHNFVDALSAISRSPKTPEQQPPLQLFIDDHFNDQLTLDLWSRLFHLNIVEVDATFFKFPLRIDLAKYDTMLSTISPAPKVNIKKVVAMHLYSVKKIGQFMNTRIATLNIGALNLRNTDICQYVHELEKNKQSPMLIFNRKRWRDDFSIGAKDLQLLFRFPVLRLCTDYLNIPKETADEFVELIAQKHRQTNIKHFFIAWYHYHGFFTNIHRIKLVDAGMKFEIVM